MESIWLEQARQMIRTHGYVEARRLCMKYRDMNSSGTASFSFHNAVLKHIDRAATVGRLNDLDFTK